MFASRRKSHITLVSHGFGGLGSVLSEMCSLGGWRDEFVD